ncbi:MAG: lysylphosphatidylglycerol synthase transmembrane domain-containing protein [Eubacteriales bacterium]|nr:lysylphosphatidylglycerol synthase transmembrane domain-containing protein [Eubacteriales bacterium]
MVKKTLLVNKLKRFKKGPVLKEQFFSDQNLLKNQISIEDYEQETLAENQEKEMQDKLGEVNQEVAKQGSKKKKITNLLLFVANIVVVAIILVYQLSNSEVESLGNIIASGLFRWQYIFLILVAFIATMLIDAFRTSSLLKQSIGKRQYSLCYKMCALGRYWDSITPLSSGGEPFQIYYLNKHNVKAGNAISVTMARYIIYQLSWLIMGICATIYATKFYGETNLVSVASFVGFGLNAALLIGTWILSRSKKLGKILVVKTLKLLHKMHIVKNYEKQYDKVMSTVSGFQNTMAKYTKNIFSFIGLVFSQILQFVVQYTIPYLVFLSLGGTPDASTWIAMVLLNVLIDLAASFIPLPGGTGMSEVSFTIVFGNLFPNGTAFWGLLLWRFMTYYSYLVQGIGVTIYDYVWGDKKFEWQKKKWELETESAKFKQNQVKKYNKRTKGKIKI